MVPLTKEPTNLADTADAGIISLNLHGSGRWSMNTMVMGKDQLKLNNLAEF